MEIGDTVDVRINENGIVLSRVRPKYSIEDLLAECPSDSAVMEDWEKMPSVARKSSRSTL